MRRIFFRDGQYRESVRPAFPNGPSNTVKREVTTERTVVGLCRVQSGVCAE